MPEIKITIRDKVAIANGVVYVCGNSDYTLAFDFDEEWGEYETKTARFVYGEKYTDVVFSGNTCQVPVLTNLYGFKVGVFAGDLHTTTPAKVAAKKSILCDKGAPADPAPDVYNQIMKMLNSGGGSGGGGVSSWNDLTDRPFYSEVAVGTVLAETSQAFNEDASAFILTDPISVTTGEEYTVKWNGTEYTCTCGEFDASGGEGDPVMAQALGNLAAMGVGDDTGEPFFILIAPADMVESAGCGALIMPLDGSTELTISITGMTEVVHQIPAKYLSHRSIDVHFSCSVNPDMSFVVTADMDASDVIRYAKTPNTTIRAVRINKGIDDVLVLGLVSATSEVAVFRCITGIENSVFKCQTPEGDPFAATYSKCLFAELYAYSDGTYSYEQISA